MPHENIQETPVGVNRSATLFREWDKVTWLTFHEGLVAQWCLRKPGITPDSFRRAGGRLGKKPGFSADCNIVALPVYGPHLTEQEPIGWVEWRRDGKDIITSEGKRVKMKSMAGTVSGWMGAESLQHISQAEVIWKTEGPGDMAALMAIIPAELRGKHIVITNSGGCGEDPEKYLPDLAGKTVYVLHDADRPGQGTTPFCPDGGAIKWSRAIASVASECRNVQLPYPIAESHGKDGRDYINEGATYQQFLELAAKAEIVKPAVKPPPTAWVAPKPAPKVGSKTIDWPAVKRDTLQRFGESGIKAAYAGMGVTVTGARTDRKGWIECTSAGRPEGHGQINLVTGQYADWATGEFGKNSLSLYDFRAKYVGGTWQEAREFFADQAGVEMPVTKRKLDALDKLLSAFTAILPETTPPDPIPPRAIPPQPIPPPTSREDQNQEIIAENTTELIATQEVSEENAIVPENRQICSKDNTNTYYKSSGFSEQLQGLLDQQICGLFGSEQWCKNAFRFGMSQKKNRRIKAEKSVPCGKCEICLLNRRRDWAIHLTSTAGKPFHRPAMLFSDKAQKSPYDPGTRFYWASLPTSEEDAISKAKKRIRGEYCAIEQCDGNTTIIADSLWTIGGLPTTSIAMADALMAAANAINATDLYQFQDSGRPITTSREWSQPKPDPTQKREWDCCKNATSVKAFSKDLPIVGARNIVVSRKKDREELYFMTPTEDPDTDETINNPDQAKKLEKRIDRGIAGLGGQQRGVARIILTTLQSPDCVSAWFTDPKKKPSFHGRRFRFLVKRPDQEDKWDEYVQMRQYDHQQVDAAGNPTDEFARRSHKFYLENKSVMDAGAEVANVNRYDGRKLADGSQMEVSALQRYFNEVARIGPDAVAAEYDNDPPEEIGPVDSGLTPHRIQRQLSGFDRKIIPPGCVMLTCGIDVRKVALHWVVRAWMTDGTGYTIDYGVYEVTGTQYGVENIGVDKAVKRAILACLEERKATDYMKPDGELLPIALTLVDAGWKTDAVKAACKEAGLGVYAYMGFGKSSGCTSPNFSPAQKQTANCKPGDGWKMVRKQKAWLVEADADRWKTWEHDRWMTAPGKPGCMYLFGQVNDHPERLSKDEKDHHSYARHICNESEIEEPFKGTIRRRFKAKSDNTHYLDASYMSDVAASIKGVRTLRPQQAAAAKSPSQVATRKPRPPRKRVSYL